jgi:hypothetical protein
VVRRRTLVIGGTAFGLFGAVSIFAWRRTTDARNFERAVEADYLSGRVVNRYGWIMSETEAAQMTEKSS